MPAGLVMSELPWEAASLTVSGISPSKSRSRREAGHTARKIPCFDHARSDSDLVMRLRVCSLDVSP